MRWRAFYADGRRYSSAVGDPLDAAWLALPPHGMVVAVWWDEQGVRHLDCGADALILAHGNIVSVNLPTENFQALADRLAGHGTLKFGEYMEPDAWAAVRAEADDARTPPAA